MWNNMIGGTVTSSTVKSVRLAYAPDVSCYGSLVLTGRISLAARLEMRMCIISVGLISFVLSGVIMALLLIPVDFEAVYPIKNASDDSLAARMSVDQLLNFLTYVPSPHVNVTDEELNRLWNLPPSAVLSPGMRAIGRCRMTMEGKYRGRDKNICNRIQVLWPKIVFMVALFNFASFLAGASMQNATGWIKDPPSMWRAKINCGKWNAMINGAAWFLTMAAYFQTSQDIGLFYTPYGEVYPRAYYDLPIAWVVVLVLCLVNYMLKIIESCCFAFATQYPSFSKNEKRRMDQESKSRWELAEKRFFENNSGVPPKMLRHVVKFCKAEYSTTAGYLILEHANPFSPVFIDAVKDYGKKKRSKK